MREPRTLRGRRKGQRGQRKNPSAKNARDVVIPRYEGGRNEEGKKTRVASFVQGSRESCISPRERTRSAVYNM